MRWLLPTLLLALTGCGSSSALGGGPTTRADLLREAPPELAQVNEAMARGRFVITLEEERQIKSVNLVVLSPDVTHYRRLGSAQWETVETQRIQQVDRMIRVRDNAKARRAALIGAAPGLLMTLLSFTVDDDPGFLEPTRGLVAAVGIVLATFGGGIGFAVVGWSDRVEETPYRAPISGYLAPTDSSVDRSERR